VVRRVNEAYQTDGRLTRPFAAVITASMIAVALAIAERMRQCWAERRA
jgi:hypothetical protein